MPGNATCKLLVLFFVLLATNAFADLAVSIQPADGNTLFYPNEVREYQVLVINTGNQAEIGTRFELNTSESLVLLEENKETNKIEVTARNDSNNPVANIVIRPALEPALQPLSPHVYTLDQLDENEAIPPQTFEFVPKGNVLGKFNAGVII